MTKLFVELPLASPGSAKKVSALEYLLNLVQSKLKMKLVSERGLILRPQSSGFGDWISSTSECLLTYLIPIPFPQGK